MACRKVCSGTLGLLLVVFALITIPGYGQGARAVLDLSNADIATLVQSAMDQGFPANKADQMTMLILNRSSLVVPLIEDEVERVLRSQSPSNKFIDTASEMIAYAGDEQSLRAIGKLLRIDAKRFGTLVSRTMENSLDYRNPFTLAYRAFEMGDDGISQEVTSWGESVLSTDRMKKLWGQAMLERYGIVPGENEWAHDPLASRLPVTLRNQLKESVTRFAIERLAVRDKQ